MNHMRIGRIDEDGNVTDIGTYEVSSIEMEEAEALDSKPCTAIDCSEVSSQTITFDWDPKLHLDAMSHLFQEMMPTIVEATEAFNKLSDSTAVAVIDHASTGAPGKKYSQPTLKSQMKQAEKNLSKGARFVVGKRGQKIQMTEKDFIGMAESASRNRQQRAGNKRFTPKDKSRDTSD